MTDIEEYVQNIIEYNKNLWEKNLLEGKVSEAIEIMSKIGDLFPDKSESFYELIRISKKLLKLYPEDMDIYYFYCHMLYQDSMTSAWQL